MGVNVTDGQRHKTLTWSLIVLMHLEAVTTAHLEVLYDQPLG